MPQGLYGLGGTSPDSLVAGTVGDQNNLVQLSLNPQGQIVSAKNVAIPKPPAVVAYGELRGLPSDPGAIPNRANLLGTTNQVVLTGSGTGVLVGSTSVTLGLPQNIHTGATPQFTRLGLGAVADATIPLYVVRGSDGDFMRAYDSSTGLSLKVNLVNSTSPRQVNFQLDPDGTGFATVMTLVAGKVGVGATSPGASFFQVSSTSLAGETFPTRTVAIHGSQSSGPVLLLTNEGAVSRTVSVQFEAPTSGDTHVFSAGQIQAGFGGAGYGNSFVKIGSASGANAFNNEVFINNNTVGILNSAPSSTFHVGASTTATDIIVSVSSDASHTSGVYLYQAATRTGYFFASSAGINFGTDQAVPVFIQSNLATRIKVSSNGDVGFGSSQSMNINNSGEITKYDGATPAAGRIMIGNGTIIVLSTPTYPNTSPTSGKILQSDGTNIVASTMTWPSGAAPTARKIVVSDGTNMVASTETWATPGNSGNYLQSDGTNWTSVAGGWVTSTVSGSAFTSTNTSLADITGLSLTAAANGIYEFEATLFVTNGGDAAGSQFGINGTNTPQTVLAEFVGGTTVSAGLLTMIVSGTTVNNAKSSTFNTTSSGNDIVFIRGWFQAPAGGTSTVTVRVAKVTSGTAQVNVGSVFRMRKVA